MRYSIIASGLTVLLLASCSVKEAGFTQTDQTDRVFYATFEQPSETDTRVYVNEDYFLRWHADDRVSIFPKMTCNQQYRFAGETGDNAGEFIIVDGYENTTGDPISHVISVYPYQESTVITTGEVLTLTLPGEQYYAENSFGRGINTMVSVSSDNDIQYKNVGSYLMLNLYGQDVSVSSVTLKGNNGEKLAGKASATMPLGGVPSIAMSDDAIDAITLHCTTPVNLGATVEESTQFWFVIPPTTFTKGFSITVTDSQGRTFEKSTSKSINLKRNIVSKMSPIEVSFDEDDYLTFDIEDYAFLSWYSTSDTFERTIYYSLNNGPWTAMTSGNGAGIEVSHGDRIRFYGNNSEYSDEDDYCHFHIDARFTASGSIMSLLSSSFKEDDQTCLTTPFTFRRLFESCNLVDASNLVLPATTLTDYCYYEMFWSCTNLIAAPELPATTLAEGCYNFMFWNCTNLLAAPELPATTLADYCYEGMFGECTSLIKAPELPATTLAEGCYSYMFSDCTSLTTVPLILPATTLADHCYGRMFVGCTNLIAAPELPATTLAKGCYYEMFCSCTNLTTAPVLPATTLAEGCYEGMFGACTSLLAAPVLPATTLVEGCYAEMFSYCTSLTTAPVLPATTLAEGCYVGMFRECTSLTTAPQQLPATTLAEYCYESMFRECTSLTTAPELPAITLAEGCYSFMFNHCTSLQYIKCLALFDCRDGSRYTSCWTLDVPRNGTFIKNPLALDWVNWDRGANGIPLGWTVLSE